MFRAAKQNRIFQDIVDQIQDAIIQGDLQAGDMLPSERDLKDTFQTSRGTLREALRVLEQKGLIEIRLGVRGGAVVTADASGQFSEGLDLLIRSQKVSLKHLAEFREDVEGAVAALAAERITRRDVQMLDALLNEARNCVVAGLERWDDFFDVDKRFHQALARISGNPIYILVHQMVHENIRRYFDDFLPVAPDIMRENFDDLRRLMDAVRAHESENAQQLARRHVHRFNEYMESTERNESAATRRSVSR